MAFHPRYFSRGLQNSSAGYDYQRWNATSRFNAAQHVKSDTRVQPRAVEPVELEPNICVLPPVGGLLMFSGAQLHSTIPNNSGRTRFSIDFRVVHHGDLEALRGAINVDSHCTGSALPDFLRFLTAVAAARSRLECEVPISVWMSQICHLDSQPELHCIIPPRRPASSVAS